MLFVFNKDKIISCIIATTIVILLFLFSASLIPDSNTKLIQVSGKTTNTLNNNNLLNNNN